MHHFNRFAHLLLPDQLAQRLHSEFLAHRVLRLRNSIRVQDEHVARLWDGYLQSLQAIEKQECQELEKRF